MNLNRGWYFFLLITAMSFSLLKGAAQPTKESGQQQLVSANTGFGFRLLKELAGAKAGDNLFISPYSISCVLQMISNGARGNTQEELREVLGITGLTTATMNVAYESLSQSISSTQSNALLNIANAVWYRTGAPLNSEFSSVNEKFYQASLAPLDFSDPHSAELMNDWASKNTHGKIRTIIQSPIPADTAIVLANAIYFKGTWLNQFDPKQTKPRAFHLANGSERQVPMMEQTRAFRYQAGSGFQALQLFYSGNRLEMQILLPDPNSSLEALLGQLDAKTWQNAVLPGFRENRGTLVLPRFKLRYGAELKNPLAALGLKSASSRGADFSGMSPSRLFLSQIKHQSFVEVNEEGTEAAAATTGVMALASIRNQPQPFQMIVDRPFLFVISHEATKSILFIGAIFDPGSSEQ
jgi:serine protease inhibitor